MYYENIVEFSPFLPGKPVKGSEANSADPDQTQHDVASDQGLHCFANRIFHQKWNKSDKIDLTP